MVTIAAAAVFVPGQIAAGRGRGQSCRVADAWRSS
jgi:hypothetical protein